MAAINGVSTPSGPNFVAPPGEPRTVSAGERFAEKCGIVLEGLRFVIGQIALRRSLRRDRSRNVNSKWPRRDDVNWLDAAGAGVEPK
jgi:hypothetical protein